ncbi:hypothetical protein HHI36_009108 [Cryptolaemus montrouzieri]|uniref:Uncharacterized protein n=1 Tax=Cryptolaemus montrouzieri TaxID=559131 RepID=A0ABD2MV60_9CUCU
MATMCIKWLSDKARRCIENLEVTFPIAGHSFIPPDRLFARIEKAIKKKDTIIAPHDFVEMLREDGTVLVLVRDVEVFEWKKDAQNAIKPPAQWHFRFNMCKRILLRTN